MHEDRLSWNKRYIQHTHIALIKYMSASFIAKAFRCEQPCTHESFGQKKS